MSIAFEGTNFVMQDIRDEISKYRSVGYPRGWHGIGYPPAVSRAPNPIKYVTCHQNYGNIYKGIKGPVSTAKFLTRSPVFKDLQTGQLWTGSPQQTSSPYSDSKSKKVGGGRGFPCLSYHVWIPYYPFRDSHDRWIIYWCVDFDIMTWHGSQANTHGVAMVWQGRFYSRHLGKKFRPWPETDGYFSDAQKEMGLQPFHEWIRPKLSLSSDAITGHFDFGKAACPGDEGETLIRRQRGEVFELPPRPDFLPGGTDSNDPFDTWTERQQALYVLGYPLGSYGPDGTGVDGRPGDVTRHAIELFQQDVGLNVDGLWGPITERAIRKNLDQSGIKDHRVEYKRKLETV